MNGVTSREKFTYLRVPGLPAFFTQRLHTFCKIGVVLVLRSFCKIGSKNSLMKFLRFRQGIICPGILLTLLFNKGDPKFRMPLQLCLEDFW